MKKIINYVITALIFVALLFGTIATVMITKTINSKDNVANYDKNGKIIVTYDVDDEYKNMYVKKLDVEMISDSENNSRVVKHYKILMDEAKNEYNADKQSESLRVAYNSAVAEYERAKITERNFNRQIFLSATQVLFTIYLPVAAFLFIALVVNKKSGNRD